MKRFLLLSIFLSTLLSGYSQHRAMIPRIITNVEKQMLYQPAIDEGTGFENPNNPAVSNPDSPKDEAQIGITWYDLQSNASLGNRLYLHPDNTISAVWTMSNDAAFNDRGTGYNYYDGSSWGSLPAARMENVKTGWPSIAPWGPNGEIIVAHTGTAQGLFFNKRDTKGTGDWESFFLTGPDAENVLVWPRMTTSGENHDVIQVITCNGNGVTWNGQTPALLYSRSSDGGNFWNPLNIVLDQIGPDHYTYINRDGYTWANPVGDTIAFGVADRFIDWFVMKSTDAGDTWQKIIIWEHPYPFFTFPDDLTTDTLWSPDGSGDVALDADGNVHAVCGLTFWYKFEVGQTYNFFPLADGIIYWNENMPPFTAPDQHDALDPYDVLTEANYIGWSQDVNNNGILEIGPPYTSDIYSYRSVGLSTMPNIAVSPNNQVFLVYASTTEGYTYGNPPQYNYKHIWTRTSYDGGIVWGGFIDLTDGFNYFYTECIYPVIAKNTNEFAHYIFQVDETPGESIHPDHPAHENQIKYYSEGGCQTLTVYPSQYNALAQQGSFTINVYSDINWHVTENCDWLQCDQLNGYGNGQITVNYDENTSTNPRNYTITVGNIGMYDFCQVLQDGLTSKEENLISKEIKIYPNPFKEETSFEYSIAEKSTVIISLFHATGYKIKELQNCVVDPGDYIIVINGKDLPSGIYYYYLTVQAVDCSKVNTRIGKIIKK
jgi:hypothetical protein